MQCREESAPHDGNEGAVSALLLDFPACFERRFPERFANAWAATCDVVDALGEPDLRALATNSPAMGDTDVRSYLRLSVIRMLYAQAMLDRFGISSGRMLDLGSYFGNFALMFQRNGFKVDALDSYQVFEQTLGGVMRLLGDNGVSLLDMAAVGDDMKGIASGVYDVVACMSVIEHIPHTPRLFLEAIDRVLKPGGYLLLDTPNAAYLYNRQKLARGESVWCPLPYQFETALPFEGHHREYTQSELTWMLKRTGLEVLDSDALNYSIFGLSTLTGADLESFRLMEQYLDTREILVMLARKPVGSAVASADVRGRPASAGEPAPEPATSPAAPHGVARGGANVPVPGASAEGPTHLPPGATPDPSTRPAAPLSLTVSSSGQGFVTLASIEAQLHECSSALEQARKEIAVRDALLTGLQAQVHAMQTTINAVQEEVALRDKMLVRVQEQLKKRDR